MLGRRERSRYTENIESDTVPTTMVEGQILSGRYQLVQQLGQGGMGSVWRAQRLTNQAEVAIKLIEPQFVASQEALARFRREAQAAEAIRSTHVVQILDYDVDGDTPFIVMELLRGEDLSKRVAREGKLSAGATAEILSQVAKAIALAHAQGIVHRDLKPGNIFIAREHEDEVVKVLDFGIAKRHSDLAESNGLHTQTGTILGTPFYMCPEQAAGREVNHLADIWALAVIAFECLTGKRAFSGDSFLELGTAICKDPMPVPSAFGTVPEGFDAWFAQAAARRTTERFQSIKAAAEALRLVCGNPAAAAPALERCEPKVPSKLSPGRAFEATRVCGESGAQTVAPASRSIAGFSRPSGRTRWLGLSAAAGVIAVGAFLGVRGWGVAREPSVPASAVAPVPSEVGTHASANGSNTETVATQVATPVQLLHAGVPDAGLVRDTLPRPTQRPPSVVLHKLPKPTTAAAAPASVSPPSSERPRSPFQGID